MRSRQKALNLSVNDFFTLLLSEMVNLHRGFAYGLICHGVALLIIFHMSPSLNQLDLRKYYVEH